MPSINIVSQYAPVVIFCYRRPEHLRKMLNSLMGCKGFNQSPLIVYADGPRSANEEMSVNQTRSVAKDLLGDRAEYHFSDLNLGLASSVISGVTTTLKKYGKVIVLEDDLELHPYFLQFMNQSLDAYSSDLGVFQVSGYMFDIPDFASRCEPIFLPVTSSWGWATWARAWKHFDPNSQGVELLLASKTMQRRFDLDGTYRYTKMLKRQISKKSDSWAIRWYWSVFKARGIVAFPPRTLVNNIGFDGTGTHGSGFLRNFSNVPKDGELTIEWVSPKFSEKDLSLFIGGFKKLNSKFSILLNNLLIKSVRMVKASYGK